jgi:hypothetical protein
MDADSDNELPLTPPHSALSSLDQPAELQTLQPDGGLKRNTTSPCMVLQLVQQISGDQQSKGQKKK